MSNLSEKEIDMNIFMVAAGLFSILVYGSLLVVSIKKKRNLLWIMVSIFFIALGMVLVLAGWHANEYETAIEVQNTPADSIEITYANLARNPEDYEEKRILWVKACRNNVEEDNDDENDEEDSKINKEDTEKSED